MKIVLGAPVAARAWALPTWFRCIREQTVRPDSFVFVYKDVGFPDNTGRILLHQLGKSDHLIKSDPTPYIPRDERAHKLPQVFRDFAQRRNHLMHLARVLDADVFISVDTDVFFSLPGTIERLLSLLMQGGADVASIRVNMEPYYRDEKANAGLFVHDFDGFITQEPWKRLPWRPKLSVSQRIDIPMAVVAMNRRVLETCRYTFHQDGEDIGFAQQLRLHGFRCVWDPTYAARHVFRPEEL